MKREPERLTGKATSARPCVTRSAEGERLPRKVWKPRPDHTIFPFVIGSVGQVKSKLRSPLTTENGPVMLLVLTRGGAVW